MRIIAAASSILVSVGSCTGITTGNPTENNCEVWVAYPNYSVNVEPPCKMNLVLSFPDPYLCHHMGGNLEGNVCFDVDY